VSLVFAFTVYANLANAFMISPLGLSVGSYMRGVGQDLLRHFWQAFFSLCFLPHQAYLMSHAILVTLYRLYISKARLLEWETAHSTEMRLGVGVLNFAFEMAPGMLLTILLGFGIWEYQPGNFHTALPFLILWLLSPAFASLLSLPIKHKVGRISQTDRNYLRDIAWETWTYFDSLMTEERHYLVPDNVQLVPERVVAERTSSTNIGLSILSVISAYDLGFISLPSVVRRLCLVADTLSQMEKFHGHFFNWYDIRTLAPLHPRYKIQCSLLNPYQ